MPYPPKKITNLENKGFTLSSTNKKFDVNVLILYNNPFINCSVAFI